MSYGEISMMVSSVTVQVSKQRLSLKTSFLSAEKSGHETVKIRQKYRRVINSPLRIFPSRSVKMPENFLPG